MTSIERFGGNARMSAVVEVNGMLYLKGITPRVEAGDGITDQATDVLAQITDLLKQAGSAVERLISVNIWLSDIRDAAKLNEIYDRWVVPGHLPVRACVQATLGQPRIRLEVQVVAAQ